MALAAAKQRHIEAAPDTSPNCIALTVQDASMAPVFLEGEVFIIDPQREPYREAYVVARLPSPANSHVLRRYVPKRDGAFDLQAEGESPTFTSTPSRPAEIVGVVIEHRMRYPRS